MTDFDALITKLEAAPEGSHILNHEVLDACGFTARVEGHMTMFYVWEDWPDHVRSEPTRLLDAAVVCVPKGWNWGRDQTGCMFVYEETWPVDAAGPMGFSCDKKSPVLALCIAALKARRAQEEA